MKIVILTVLLSIVVSCGDLVNKPYSLDAYEQWRSYNIHNYTIEQVRYCFCPDAGEKVIISVRSDTVYSVKRFSDSIVLPFTSAKNYLSIDSLFGIIRESKTDSLVIIYDSEYGYPAKLDINPQLHPVDGGVLYETSNLQIIK